MKKLSTMLGGTDIAQQLAGDRPAHRASADNQSEHEPVVHPHEPGVCADEQPPAGAEG